ncbi:hypothetical protein ABB37_01592 [Leptomonas pyrrhocoris]|uniref:Leucine rich repeat protein n=1 Tax=Leptomonas pyrrhocoris TaxID=157538 RepID=A0A0M9G8X5_LEPPY|nr:hypothetical protein ABB37_01592 [Leptomonas pyrrhocoris]KPA85240.1 hypothetical protein ABB37_01592 [Leptomonas pyrrhocoris]|eukprot:XP_015663679.1 hypothetical protein ABB37_01592 [Leptomonas pyrrhocoris]
MTAAHCAHAEVYISACKREHAQCSNALVHALDTNAKSAAVGQGEVPLNDVDMCCVAEVVRVLAEDCALRVLVLEENSFGLQGITGLMEAIEANPNRIRELRLGRNNLKDQAAVIIGHTLSRSGCGLKVLDLSENGITKLGVIPIAAALQKPFSDIVELSFHNNKIEGDAASYLGEAVRAAPKLKHLHLGYNALRDTGATQLARSIPRASCLSTLDLTANRISRGGGEELARALLSPSCTVQRLNLRHNQLDSETITKFADVVAHNTSLIQLFLGFMNPSPEAAAAVLGAVPQNHTLLLLDVYGWKLSPKSTLPLIRAIQDKNSSIAAIVTDACQPIAAQVDEGNVVREEERDLHPVYVGPDDRDAYLATKSLRRYSRAQSRRQSRMTSRVQSRARGESQPASRTASSRHRSGRESSRSSRARSHRSEREDVADGEAPHRSSSRHSRHRSGSAPYRRHHHHRGNSEAEVATAADTSAPPSARSASRNSRAANGERGPRASESARSPRTARTDESARAPHAAEAGQLVPVSAKKIEQNVDMLMDELGHTPCDPHTVSVLKTIINALQTTCAQQRMQMQALTERVGALEKRRECHCGAASLSANNAGAPARTSRTESAVRSPPQNASGTAAGPEAGPGASQSSGAPFQRGASAAGQGEATSRSPFRPAENSAADAAAAGQASIPRQDQNSTVNFFQRSMSRLSQNTASSVMERCTTPHVSQDVPPEIAHPNDEAGEHHPEGVELQRSVSIPNFPPRIEPSPAQDSMPPRRKSISHAF